MRRNRTLRTQGLVSPLADVQLHRDRMHTAYSPIRLGTELGVRGKWLPEAGVVGSDASLVACEWHLHACSLRRSWVWCLPVCGVLTICASGTQLRWQSSVRRRTGPGLLGQRFVSELIKV
jgi:hypothetical protein